MTHRRNGVVALALMAPLLVGQEHAPRSAWNILLEAHDANGDGKIAASEYTRSQQSFKRLDIDGDGWITEADLSSPARDQHAMESMMGDVVGWLADENKDDTVTRDEWRAVLDGLDPDADGVASPEALAQTGLEGPMLGGIIFILDRDRDGKLQVVEMDALFRQLDKNGDEVLAGDEIVNWRPSRLKVGDPAPLFELPRVDDPGKTVGLADFRGKLPVALIFGSFT